MELEQKNYVKTKKKEILEEVLNLLSKYSYGEEEYNIDDYKDFTWDEDKIDIRTKEITKDIKNIFFY